MNIKKDRLYVIGRLIGIYREQRRGKSQNSFTQKSFAKDICSVNTLKRIESGETARDEYVYQSLLAKFNLKLGYYEDVDNYIESLMDSLYDAIEYYRLEDILTICGKALRVLNEVKEYIYYNEIYALFKSTYQYYKEDIEVDVETMEHFYKIYSFMNDKYETLYRSMIFARVQIEYVHNPSQYYQIMKKLDFFKSNNLSERLYALHYYLLSENFIRLKEEIDILEKEWIKNNNFIKLLDVYIYAIALYNKIGKEYKSEYIEKALNIIDINEIPNSKIMQLYSNLASQYYLNNDYEMALDYFNKMLDIADEDIYLPFLVYIAHIQSRLNKSINIPTLKESLTTKYPKELQLIYNYYREYATMPDLIKQNFIVKEIAPLLCDRELIKIFKYELTKLVENTNNYKNLYFFDKVISENMSVDIFQ